MKKRIFIHMHYLELGGAETSLIGLLHALNPDKVEVDLFLNEHRGEMMKYIPGWVNLLSQIPEYSSLEQPIAKIILKGRWGVALGRLIGKFKFGRYQKRKKPQDNSAIFGYIGKYVNPFLPSLKKYGCYDLAISFLTPHNIVLEKVDAKKKICWIHTDYSYIDVNTTLEFPVWDGYDRIISISDKVSEKFAEKFPALKNKLLEMENILHREFILKRAEEFIPEEMKSEDESIKLLTIGRYCHAKNLESIPHYCKLLIERGINLRWFIIGYGGSDDYIREEIRRQGVEDNVIILGKKENPYPYIKACGWYVQPSRYEGKSITVREAQLLGKPVVITNYPTAASQIKNGIDGIIVSMDSDETASQIADAILNVQFREKIINNIKTTDYSLSKEVNKLYSLLEE